MNKYKKKPIIVEAFIFPDSGPEQGELADKLREQGAKIHLYDGNVQTNIKTSTDAVWNWNYAFIDTPEGGKAVGIGDYIIKGIKGEFYPCKPDIFKMTYEKVEENK